MTIKQKVTRYVTLILVILTFSGCATIEGVGEDLESAGEAVQDAADG